MKGTDSHGELKQRMLQQTLRDRQQHLALRREHAIHAFRAKTQQQQQLTPSAKAEEIIAGQAAQGHVVAERLEAIKQRGRDRDAAAETIASALREQQDRRRDAASDRMASAQRAQAVSDKITSALRERNGGTPKKDGGAPKKDGGAPKKDGGGSAAAEETVSVPDKVQVTKTREKRAIGKAVLAAQRQLRQIHSDTTTTDSTEGEETATTESIAADKTFTTESTAGEETITMKELTAGEETVTMTESTVGEETVATESATEEETVPMTESTQGEETVISDETETAAAARREQILSDKIRVALREHEARRKEEKAAAEEEEEDAGRRTGVISPVDRERDDHKRLLLFDKMAAERRDQERRSQLKQEEEMLAVLAGVSDHGEITVKMPVLMTSLDELRELRSRAQQRAGTSLCEVDSFTQMAEQRARDYWKSRNQKKDQAATVREREHQSERKVWQLQREAVREVYPDLEAAARSPLVSPVPRPGPGEIMLYKRIADRLKAAAAEEEMTMMGRLPGRPGPGDEYEEEFEEEEEVEEEY